MNKDDFKQIKMKFALADLEEKIEIYTSVQGLSVGQYKELLRLYPYDKWDMLEKAME